MKKKLTAVIAGICAVTLLGGCAGDAKKLSNSNITINQYKGLEVDKVEVLPVTDEDVELSIQSDLEMIATMTDITGRPAQLGDFAIIDFEGKKDGVAFEGGTATDYELELGAGQLIDGFEDGVVGHDIGQTFDLNLKFPESYSNKELAGQDVVFTVTLKGLQEKYVPELTVDILEQLESKATTIEEHKAQVRSDLEVSNQKTAEATLMESIWETLVANCEVKKFPSGMIDKKSEELKEQYSYFAQMYNMELEDFFKQMYGTTIEGLAKKTATLELAVALIAEKEGLELTGKQFDKAVKELAKQYAYEEVKEFEEAYGKDAIRKSILQDEVGKFLVKNAVQVEPKEKTEK